MMGRIGNHHQPTQATPDGPQLGQVEVMDNVGADQKKRLGAKERQSLDDATGRFQGLRPLVAILNVNAPAGPIA